jgi:reactive intermediate/imine deaminase
MGREEISVDGLHEPLSHYTDAVRFGELLFISGCTPIDAEMNLVGTDAATQCRKVLDNMAMILAAAGCGFRDVLKVTVYLTDASDRTLINPVRREYFGDAKPASTLVEVASLAIDGMKVEIDAIAGLTRQ